jgi:hypothetical protein
MKNIHGTLNFIIDLVKSVMHSYNHFDGAFKFKFSNLNLFESHAIPVRGMGCELVRRLRLFPIFGILGQHRPSFALSWFSLHKNKTDTNDVTLQIRNHLPD